MEENDENNTDALNIENNNEEDEEEEEEEEVTAQSVLQNLKNAWLNEKFAPEILPHKSDLVDAMLHQIKYMEDNLKRLPKGDFRLLVHKTELDRIRFIITSYLRTRLEKIERYVIYILQEENKRSEDDRYLMPNEYRFAQEFLENMKNLFELAALQHMPEMLQSFDTKIMMIQPNMNAHVFLRSNKLISGFLIDGANEAIDLLPQCQYLLPYSTISELVKQNIVQLI